MDKFFNLASQKTHDKVIKREQRIYADTLLIPYNEENTVETSSKSPYQKIKFFLDVIRLYDDTTEPITDRYYRVGKYIEIEPFEVYEHMNSQGWLPITYQCTENTGNGIFSFTLNASDPRYSLYISSVVFEDSFYNPTSGWLNPNNPANLNSLLQVEEFPTGGENVNLAYANLNINNVSAVVNPYLNYVPLYSDNFIDIGYVKPAAASINFLVFPKDIHSVKATDKIPAFPYKGSGALTIELPLASATIAVAAATAQQINEPYNISEVNPTWNDVPSGVGFLFTLVAGGIKLRYTWQAIDGYTYGLEVSGNVYAIAANAAADFSVIYLGRNLTGYSPVPKV